MPAEQPYYIVDGERVPLRWDARARYVTPGAGESAIGVGARLARSSRLALDTHTPGALVVRGEPDKLAEITTYRDVQNTRSVLVDQEGLEIILTNEVLLRFHEDASEEERTALVQDVGAYVVDRAGDLWTIRVADPADDAPLETANHLHDDDLVEYAEPNALQSAVFHQLAPAPTDALFGNQWHLENTGQGDGTPGADVRARGAWAETEGSAAIRICIHDTGVDIDHPDLVGNMGSGWDFDNDDNNPSNNGPPPGPHGTACAGVAAAPRNDLGVVGIAPSCRIVPLRATSLTWSEWADTFEWAAERSDVISCSWSISPNNTLSTAIRNAANEGRDGRGIPIFFATGNSGAGTISYPASMAETIAVGASTNEDVRANYSQFGAGLDFVAPSSGGTLRIETTDVAGANGYNSQASPAGDYCNADDATGFGGTSSATPLAAGVGGLVLSANAALTGPEVRQIMRDTAVKIDPANAAYDATGLSNQYGFGRIDAAAAVEEAVRRRPPRLDGDVVVAWQDDRDQNGVNQIFARGFDPDGQQRFSEFTVNSVASGQQYRPSVGVGSNGDFVVVWQDDQDGNGLYQIYARGFTADSNERFGDMTVNSAAAGQQTKPDVAVAPNGDFVVVWEDDKDKNGLYQIYARGFRADGSQKFADITVNSKASGQQLRPRVGIASNGHFVVVWEDDKDKNGFYQILARGFKSNGSEKFADFAVNSVAKGQQRRPAIAVAPNGHFVVVWEDDKDKNGFYQILARGFNSLGNEKFADMTVNTEGAGQQRRPDIAIDPDGDFVVVWQDDKDKNGFYQILARGFLANGDENFGDITVNRVASGQQLRPRAAMATNGDFVVVWEDDRDKNDFYQIRARGFASNGVEKFGEIVVNQVAAGQQRRPAIAVRPR